MQRDDYKDALNELQLSSKFCEEMEQKLAESKQTTEDEYEDVVTHVDVIKPKRFRGFAMAAAFVICAGVIGGGAYYRYGERSGIEPNGEHMIYDDYGEDREDEFDESERREKEQEKKMLNKKRKIESKIKFKRKKLIPSQPDPPSRNMLRSEVLPRHNISPEKDQSASPCHP